MSLSMFPDQVDALRDLVHDTPGAFALEVEAATHFSLRVVLFVRDDDRPADEAVVVRWFTVSVAGTVREQAPDPEPVAS